MRVALTVADFLDRYFSAPRYEALRRSIIRTVEGYDAADPHRMSTLALREEWMTRDDGEHGRIAEGYGALIEHLAANCRRHGGTIHLGAAVTAIDEVGERVIARCCSDTAFAADAAVLSVPLPLLSEIALPPTARAKAAMAGEIGYGNVVKILLRFAAKWWSDLGDRDFTDLSFLLSNAPVPTWCCSAATNCSGDHRRA